MNQYTNTSSNNDTTYPLATTVMKALTLLEFIAHHQPVQPAVMTRELKLTRANVHRLLATLIRTGYLEKVQNGYQLSLKLFQLGSTVPVKEQLRELAREHMHMLERKVRENIYLTVLYNDQVIAIEEVKSVHTVVLNPDIVYTYPVNCCASGKILLSSYTDENLDAYLENIEMVQRTEHSIMDKVEFRRQIKKAGDDCFALELLEHGDHLNSVASPIRDRNGDVIAAIGVSGPSMRLTEEKLKECIEPLKTTAALITEKLIQNNRSLNW